MVLKSYSSQIWTTFSFNIYATAYHHYFFAKRLPHTRVGMYNVTNNDI